jgi:tetratricopeptide (TPR) repeat protein
MRLSDTRVERRVSSLRPEAPREDESRLGPYLLHEPVGVGGMGTVYRAEHRDTGEVFAIKTVTVRDAALCSGIRREIHALSHVRHPNVIRIVDEGVSDGVPWYAMELLEGTTLRELIQDSAPVGRAHLPQLLTLMHGVCEALEFLHGEGIVHRDVKPENIFLRGPKREPVLMDFGLASRFRPELGREVLEVPSALSGTTGYLAPELVRGAAVDARADLYALGCVLYECLTGQVPFLGETIHEVLQMHLKTKPSAPSSLNPQVPTALDALVLRLLEKEPRDRGARARDVSRELESLGAEVPHREPRPAPRAYLYRSELLGRDAALHELVGRLEGVLSARRGLVCCVGGESGCGKTRLALELSRHAQRAGFRVIAAVCNAAAGPLYPLRPLLEAVAEHCEDLTQEAQRAFLGPHGSVLAPFIALKMATPEAAATEGLSARAIREQVLFALRHVLTALCEHEPLVLVLDDLQWGDELTLSFLLSLAEHPPDGISLFVVSTYRSDDVQPALARLNESQGVHRVALSRLDSYACFQMVDAMLGTTSAPSTLSELVWKKSGGNPFFIAEYLHSMLGEGLLHRDALGQWHVDDALLEREAALSVPQPVRVVIERRLARLSREARRVLEAASVLGHDMSAELLATLTGLSDAALLEATSELTSRAFLQDQAQGELRFVHDRLREVTYDACDAASKRDLHRAAAFALEAHHQGERGFFLVFATLAHHFERAGEIDRAIRYLERAGESINRAGGHREALSHLERAERLCDDPRASEVTPLLRARLARLAADAAFGLGRLEDCRAHAERALRILGIAVPRGRLSTSLSLLSNLGRQLAHLGAPTLTEARDEPARTRLAEAALAAQRIAERHYFAFDAASMIDASLLSVNLAERAGSYPRVPRTYAMLGVTVGLARLDGLAARYFERALSGARSTHDLSGLVFARYAQAAHLIGKGQWDEVREAADEAFECAARLGDRSEINVVQTIMGHVEFYTGELEASAERYAAIAESASETDNPQHHAWGLYARARALLELGVSPESLTLLLAARNVLAKHPELASEIICFGLLARAYLAEGDEDAALGAAREAEVRILSGAPVVFSAYSGYVGAAELRLHRLRTTQDRAEAEAARRMRRALSRFAASFPIARPSAARIASELAHLQGRANEALRLARESLDSATRLGMHHDAALARRQLEHLSR